ncbi:MAG: toxin-antitoxin system TumE family protein [Chloroflexota bacterium]
MAVNALGRIAILRNLASEIIIEIEVLAASNPNLIRLRAEFINSDRLYISEAWDDESLIRYAYYWLKQNDELRMGWDNAPHHPKISTHPHHTHIATQENIQASEETSLEDVLRFIKRKLAAERKAME